MMKIEIEIEIEIEIGIGIEIEIEIRNPKSKNRPESARRLYPAQLSTILRQLLAHKAKTKGNGHFMESRRLFCWAHLRPSAELFCRHQWS